MSFLNEVLRRIVDGILYPFRDASPLLGLSILSLATAMAILILFKYTSDQKALENIKRRIHAGLFEIRLYNDDFRAIVKSQIDILLANFIYLRHSLIPMLWLIVPLSLLVAQMQFHYGYQGLEVGKQVLLKVNLSETALPKESKPSITITSPDELEIDIPPVWIPVTNEMVWRMTPKTQGNFSIKIGVNDETTTKSVAVSKSVVRRSPYRIKGFWNQLLYPAEPPLTGNSISSITITYPNSNIGLLGFETHWMVFYFLMSIVFAFLFKRPFGITL